MKKSFFLAFGGIISALIIIMMYISGVAPTSRITILAAAAFIQGAAVAELGVKRSIAIYIVVAVLAGLLIPSKLMWLLYIAVFGQYPLIAGWTYDFKNRGIGFLVRIIHFDLIGFAGYFLGKYTMSFLWNDDFLKLLENYYTKISSFLGTNGVIIIIIAGNLLFLLFDRIYAMVMKRYKDRISPLIHKMK